VKTITAVLTTALLAACATPPTPELETELSEAAIWLQEYLRIDTSNPPGGESAACDLLASILTEAGIQFERLDSGDGRASLWATLPPTAPSTDPETLLLLHHTDVVPATGEWAVPPFAGEVRDGMLWGRGAIDSKSLGMTHLAALVALSRSGAERRRGVALLASADEETGGSLGVERWLEQRPDLFSGLATVVNEGGFNRGYQGRLHWWGMEIAQKRPLWIEATSSSPEELVAGLARLVRRPPQWRVSPQAQFTFTWMAPHYIDHWSRIFRSLGDYIKPAGPTVGLMPGMEVYFLDSLQVNQMEVVPGTGARARIDSRLLPDTDQSQWLTDIGEALGPAVTVEVVLAAPPVESSPWSGPWIEIAQRHLSSVAPVLPQMAAGITDSRFFRQAGVPAYGFSPFILDSVVTRSVHARDERIPIEAFDAGVGRMTDLVAAWANGD